MKKYLFLAVIFFWQCGQPHAKGPISFSGRTMGTSYQVTLWHSPLSPQERQNVARAIEDILKKINRQMSTYIPTSDITRFNGLPVGAAFGMKTDFRKVFSLARKIYHESAGAFDVTVGPLVQIWGFGTKKSLHQPPATKEIQALLDRVGMDKIRQLNDSVIVKTVPGVALDFSAIAKGYAVDEVARWLKRAGYRDLLVEIGGEVVAGGTKSGEPWRIGIDKPIPGVTPGEALQVIVRLRDQALATSGDYRNFFRYQGRVYSHEIDPRTGYPVANNVASVSVIAPTCARADAMATAIMVLGAQKGLQWIEKINGVEGLIVLREGEKFKTMMSSGFDKFILESGK